MSIENCQVMKLHDNGRINRSIKASSTSKYRSALLLTPISNDPHSVSCFRCCAERRHSCTFVPHNHHSLKHFHDTSNFTITNPTNFAKFNAAGSWIRNFDCVLKRNSAHLSPSSSSVPLENYL